MSLLNATVREIRPQEGWLSFGLLLSIVLCVAIAVVEVNWVPEDVSVVFLAVCGMVLGAVLAKREIGGIPAGILITLYGLLTTLATVGQLYPTLEALLTNTAGRQFRQQTALLIDKSGSWLGAVTSGGRSQETIVFALGIGFLAWGLCAYTSWVVYRQHRPFVGLTILGLALALNGYFSNDESTFWAMAVFIGLSALLTATMHFAKFERGWSLSGVDYSEEIRFELLVVAAVAAVLLLMLAFLMPAMSATELARRFQQLPLIQSAEDTLERIFAGVNASPPQSAGARGGGGILPRSFLLGDAPELSETVVMSATLSAEPNGIVHWRAISYDIYTGSGWERSDEREEVVPAGQLFSTNVPNQSLAIEQTVYWQQDNRLVRYTYGQPTQFEQEVTVHWRGDDDLIRVWGEGNVYALTSHVPLMTANDLRETSLDTVPPLILGRYTDLPAGIPDRVHELAQEIVAPYDNPYDQAKAIEQFVRQYPYSLELELPTRPVDPVDYFLFELQSGYCDYYASAMAVLARSAGLPARFAIGYLPQTPDENGIQTIRQINAHSWAEIYFAGYGWVEFEPTGAFETSDLATATLGTSPLPEDAQVDDTPSNLPIPEVETRRFVWEWLLLLPAGVLIITIWYTTRQRPDNKITWAYGRLGQMAIWLGYAPRLSQTPFEFEMAFLRQLQGWQRYERWMAEIRPGITKLTQLFTTQQYANQLPNSNHERKAYTTWQAIRLRLWLLRFRRQDNSKGKNNASA